MKVSGGLGLTLGAGNGEYIKPFLVYHEIDLDRDVAEQLQEARPAVELILKEVLDRIDSEIIEKLMSGEGAVFGSSH